MRTVVNPELAHAHCAAGCWTERILTDTIAAHDAPGHGTDSYLCQWRMTFQLSGTWLLQASGRAGHDGLRGGRRSAAGAGGSAQLPAAGPVQPPQQVRPTRPRPPQSSCRAPSPRGTRSSSRKRNRLAGCPDAGDPIGLLVGACCTQAEPYSSGAIDWCTASVQHLPLTKPRWNGPFAAAGLTRCGIRWWWVAWALTASPSWAPSV